MKTLKSNPENIERAVDTLKRGGVIAHPADTCYGLAADLLNETALKKVQTIKGRDGAKPMSIMLPAHLKGEINQYAKLTDFAEMVCEKLLPGPVTLVLPKGSKIPDFFFPEIETVGIRIPLDVPTNDLLSKFRGPIITTSANLSGQATCSKATEVIQAFENAQHQPDFILVGEIEGDCLPSTVISLVDDEVKILREGPMKKGQIESILGISI